MSAGLYVGMVARLVGWSGAAAVGGRPGLILAAGGGGTKGRRLRETDGRGGGRVHCARAAVQATRKPSMSWRPLGSAWPRAADRQPAAVLRNEPPRMTRCVPLSA